LESKKNECNDLINRWKMTFQASGMKSRYFLDLVDSDDNILELAYSKDSTWFKHFGHSNTLCTRASRMITNHALISKYRLRFFPEKSLAAFVGNILLNQDDTSFMSARDLINTGIQEET